MSRLEQARTLGQKIREFLDEKKWSDREMSRLTGIHPSSIADYLEGITLPNKENREKIAGAMGLDVDELDMSIGLKVAKPKRKIDEILRDIRLLDDEEFSKVAEVVFERSLKQLKGNKKPRRSRSR